MAGQWLGEIRQWIDRMKADRVAFRSEPDASGRALIRLELSQDDVWLCVPRD
jgi:hypothetical protein